MISEWIKKSSMFKQNLQLNRKVDSMHRKLLLLRDIEELRAIVETVLWKFSAHYRVYQKQSESCFITELFWETFLVTGNNTESKSNSNCLIEIAVIVACQSDFLTFPLAIQQFCSRNCEIKSCSGATCNIDKFAIRYQVAGDDWCKKNQSLILEKKTLHLSIRILRLSDANSG